MTSALKDAVEQSTHSIKRQYRTGIYSTTEDELLTKKGCSFGKVPEKPWMTIIPGLRQCCRKHLRSLCWD